MPYLRPYDVFDYLPRPSDHLSRARTPGIESYRPRRGVVILQTCSGRNLGPSVMADSYLTKFVVSDDMIRIDLDAWDDAAFVLAFLNSPTGQALLRQGKTGSVIDHLSVAHVSEISVPWFENPLRRSVARRMSDAVTKRERARVDLDTVQSAYNARLPVIDRPHPPRQRWTLRCDCRQTRLDAAFHDLVVSQVAAELLAWGGSGMVAFQAEGRAEEGIALPVLITRGRDGWFANNHVMRLRPRSGVVAGALFLAINSPHAQLQIKARSTGSVVDAVSAPDIGSVVLPPLDDTLGRAAEDAWTLLDQADADEAEAIADLEAAMESVTGEVQLAV